MAVLIVESRTDAFAASLQATIEAAGAQSCLVADAGSAMARCREREFSAAAVHALLPRVVDYLDVPVVVYGSPEMPDDPQRIAFALARAIERWRR